jgi:WD40 repeat protein/serine/threonine protein kinase
VDACVGRLIHSTAVAPDDRDAVPVAETAYDARGRGGRGALELRPGQRLGGYEVVRKLGQGSMGVVYLARDLTLGRKAALKVIHPERLGSAEAVERFLFEARATARFSHPHIVVVYGAGTVGTAPWVALEFLDGETLRARLERERLTFGQALQIALPIAQAVAEAHRGRILHRDLKPENVFQPLDGRLRVMDFGLAKTLAAPPASLGSVATPARTEVDTAPTVEEAATLTEAVAEAETLPPAGDSPPRPASPRAPTSSIDPAATVPDEGPPIDPFVTHARGLRGTALYMSPEQWRLAEPTSAVDVWALGVMMFEMLAGARPFDGTAVAVRHAVCDPAPAPSLAARAPGLPHEVTQLVDDCLAKEAARRPAAAEVVERLERALRRQRRPGAGGPEESPYRGLMPFGREHAGLFFGRDTEIAQCLERLRHQALLPVIGPSGAGKSSLLLAGVVPALEEQGDWIISVLRPGAAPLRALAARLAGLTTGSRSRDPGDSQASRDPGAPTEAELEASLRATPARLGALLRARAAETGGRVLLVVDQLEEVYVLTHDPAERAAFAEALALAADDPDGPVRVVVTIRDDFLGRLGEHAALAAALDRGAILVRTPGEAALTEIVRRPLAPLGYGFEDDALVEEIVRRARGEPAALPLLQFALQRLWETRDRERHLLRRADYESMGGVEGALADHADGVIEALSPAAVRTARLVLLRLTTPEGTRARVRLRELQEELGDETGRIIDRLVAARLVVARRGHGAAEGDAALELAHESLLTRWGRLRRWREESRDDLAAAEQLRAAAGTWVARGRRAEDLWRGESLAEGLRWQERLGRPPPVDIAEFLAAAAERERRAALRQRRLRAMGATGAAVALVAAVVVALVIAGKERAARRAEAAAEVARAEAQRRLALALVSDAMAALERGEHPQARARVRSALEAADVPAGRVLWQRLLRQPERFRYVGHGSQHKGAFTPDGRRVVLTGDEPLVRVFDVDTGEGEALRTPGNSTLFGLAVTSDGRRAVVGGYDGEVTAFDLVANRLLGPLGRHPSPVTSVVAAPDDDVVSVTSDDGTLGLWDRAGRLRWPALLRTPGARSAAFTPDGRHLVAAIDPARVAVRLVSDATVVRTVAHADVRQVAMSHDGRTFATGGLDDTVRLWDLGSGARLGSWSCGGGGCESVALDPTGTLLATGSHAGRLLLRDLRDGSLAATLTPHGALIEDVRFSRDGRHLLTSSFDGTARLFDVATLRRGTAGPLHFGRLRAVAVLPDGRRLVSGGWDGQLLAWDLGTGARRLVGVHPPQIYAVCVSPDGRRVASTGEDGAVRVWDLDRGARLATLTGPSLGTLSCAFGADGRDLVATSNDGSLVRWTIAGNVFRVLDATMGARAVALSADGRLGVGPANSRVWLFDPVSGRRRAELRDIPGLIPKAAVARDGSLVAAGGSDGVVRVWRGADGAPVARLTGHVGRVVGVAFDAAGQLLATGGEDGTVRLWRAPRFTSQAVLRMRHTPVGAVALDEAGTVVVAATDRTGAVAVWDTRTGLLRWRAPLLLPGPPAVLVSHRGLEELAPDSVVATPVGAATLPAALRGAIEAVASRAALAALTPSGDRLALATPADEVELWDTTAGRAVAHRRVPGVVALVALADGFVTLADGAADRWRCTGGDCVPTRLGDAATAIASDGHDLLVVTGDEVRRFDEQGQQLESARVAPGATAVQIAAGRLVLGYPDGSLAIGAAAAGAPRLQPGPRRVVTGVPPRPVTALAAGPGDMVAAGFADGTVLLLGAADAQILDRGRVNGPVRHLLVAGGALHAASDLGDHLSWDLGRVSWPYCRVVRELWRDVPAAWDGRRAVRQPPPARHQCRE